MIRGFRGWAVILIVIALMSTTVSLLSRSAREGSATVAATEMREELWEIRAGLTACITVRDRLESDFEAVARRTDLLRQELDRLEDLDPRGVPQESYGVYLQLVEEYNESIPEWADRAERLRRQSSSCRTLVEAHNEQADSLRRFLVDEGLLEEAWVD